MSMNRKDKVLIGTFIGVAAVITMTVILSICGVVFGNRSIMDATMSFERGIIAMPDGSIVEGRVSSWLDFEDGDQIQVRINGKTYLTHSSNVILISE